MKSKRALMIAFVVVTLIAGLFIAFSVRDKKEPVINISNLNGVYDEKEIHDGTLLKNVTAWDEKDKDVTESVVVESIMDVGGGNVKVTFVARDKSNNIARETAMVHFRGEIKSTEGETKNVESEHVEEETTKTPIYPVISMKANETTIAVGGRFVVSGFVSQITDDKDDRNELFRRLMIKGQYDNKTPGDYSVYVYCKDSDGNTSKMMPFVIHVK